MLFHIDDRYFTYPFPQGPASIVEELQEWMNSPLPSTKVPFSPATLISPLESMVVDILHPFGIQLPHTIRTDCGYYYRRGINSETRYRPTVI